MLMVGSRDNNCLRSDVGTYFSLNQGLVQVNELHTAGECNRQPRLMNVPHQSEQDSMQSGEINSSSKIKVQEVCAA